MPTQTNLFKQLSNRSDISSYWSDSISIGSSLHIKDSLCLSTSLDLKNRLSPYWGDHISGEDSWGH